MSSHPVTKNRPASHTATPVAVMGGVFAPMYRDDARGAFLGDRLGYAPSGRGEFVVDYEVPRIGVVRVPARWLGRRSKLTGELSISRKKLAEATGLSRQQLDDIFTGKSRPYQRTVDALARAGVVVPRVYSQRDRVIAQVERRCARCHRMYLKSNMGKPGRFCSHACAMKAWHANQRRDRRCNWCGKRADGRYAFICKAHDEAHRRNSQRAATVKRERFEQRGLCISCSVVKAWPGGQTCLLCSTKRNAAHRGRRRRAKEERRGRGMISVQEAGELLGFRRYQSVHHLIARGRLFIAETTGRLNKRFWLLRDEVERYRSWRDGAKKQPWRSLADPADLLGAVKRLIPSGVPEDVADDAVGAIMLDILEKKIEIDHLNDAPTLNAYIREAFKWRGDMFKVSLDKPINDDGDLFGDLVGVEDGGFSEVDEELSA